MSGNLSNSINNRENSLVQPSETIFTVQVGVYSVRDTAIITIAELRRVGINCSVNKSKKLYKVSCGSLGSKKDANGLRMELAGLGHKDAFVVTVKRDKLTTDSSIANIKNIVTKSLSESPQEQSVNGNTGTINNEKVQKEKKSSIDIASETDNNEIPLVPILQEKDSKGTEDSVNDINTEKTVEQDNIALMERIQVIGKSALKGAAGEKRNLLVLITVVVLVITLMFFLVLIFIRRVGSIQAIRANKIMESHKDLFNSIARDKISVGYVAKKLSRLGNGVLIEQILDKAAARSGSQSQIQELYDKIGITKKYIDTLINSKSWKKRAFACEKLGQIGSGKAVPILLSIICDENNKDEDVRSVALRALGRIRDKRAIPVLIEALGYPETWLPPRIGEILVNIGEESIYHLKKELRNFQNESRRGWSAEILGWLEAKNAVDSLAESLLDASPEVRARAAGALGKIKDERAIGKLTELLISEPIPFVRTRVSQALGNIGNPSVLHYLVNILKDPEWWVRVRAVEALEQLGEESTPSLLIALEDEDIEVRKRSALALERIGYVERILKEYGEGNYKAELRRILFQVAQSGVIESLSERLETAEGHLQKRIVRLLGEAKTREATDPLVELLKSTDEWTLKARIIQSLGTIGADESIPLLIEHLKDSEYWVRRAAVEALGKLDAKEFSDDIAIIMEDPNPHARESALSALSMLKVTTHWKKIEKLLLDPALKVRSTALRVMRELGITTDREKILATLHESSEDVRIEAIKYFAAIMEAEVLVDILKLIPNGSDALRQQIVDYIETIKPDNFESIKKQFNFHELSKAVLATLLEIASIVKDDASYEFIFEFTGSMDEYLRENAFKAMAKFGFHGRESIFEKALLDPARSVRTIVLACVGPDTADTFLEKAKVLANDPDENVRLALALAIGASGCEQLKPFIISMFDDPSAKVVAAAFISLTSFHDPMFLKYFYEKKNIKEIRIEINKLADDKRFQSIVDDISTKARKSGSLEVGLLLAKNDREFANEMVNKLKESLDPVVRINAIEMLKFIATPDLFTSILGIIKKDPFADVRIEALEVMTEIGRDDEVITALSSSLADPAPIVRNMAAGMLSKHKKPKALEALLNVLDTTDREFRESVTTSLSELLSGDPEIVAELVRRVPERKTRKIGMAWLMGKSQKKGSIKFLMNLLDDHDPEVRAAAVGAIGKFRKKQLINRLEGLIYDPNERVRAATVNAIAHTGAERSFQIIQTALQDIDEFVRMRAVISLSKLDMNKSIRILKAMASKYPESRSYLRGVLIAAGQVCEDYGKIDTIAIKIVDELCSKEEMFSMLRQSSDKERRLHALRVLSIINADNNQDILEIARKDPASEIRKEAGKLVASSAVRGASGSALTSFEDCHESLYSVYPIK